MNNLIEDIAKIENELVLNAPKEYGDYYINCIKFFELLRTVRTTKSEIQVFDMFWNQVLVSCSLFILSTLRKHTVQSSFMLRQIYEAVSLSAYSLYEKNIENYGAMGKDGLEPNQKTLNKAYKWLEKNYPEYSDYLQRNKSKISELFIHPNIFSVFLHIKHFPEDNKTRGLCFDKESSSPTEMMLLGFSKQMYHFLITIIDINKEHHLIDFNSNIEHDAEILYKETQNLIDNLIKSQYFQNID
jgi:hypothetical protein